MFDIDVRTVKASLQGGVANTQYAVKHFTINTVINGLPTVTVTGARTQATNALNQPVELASTDNVTEFSLEAMAGVMGQDQAELWNGKVPTEFVFTVEDDGNGNSAQMSSYCSAPGLSVSAGNVLEKRTLVHPDVSLSGMDLSIYNPKVAMGNATSKIRPDDGSVCSDHVSTLVKDLLNKEKFIVRHTSSIQPISEDYFKDIDVMNREIFVILNQVLANSADTKLELNAISSRIDAAHYKKGLLESIRGSSNMLAFLQGFLVPSFLFQAITPWDSGLGSMTLSHNQANATPIETIQLDLAMGQLNLGERAGAMPLGQTLCVISVSTAYGQANLDGENTRESAGRRIAPAGQWPAKKVPSFGRTQRVAVPSWMLFGATAKPQSSTQTPTTLNTNNITRNAEQAAEDSRTERDEGGGKSLEWAVLLADEWAKKHHCASALANSGVVLKIPLNIKWGGKERPLGRVYTILAKGGVKLFDGYLQSATHDVHLGEDDGKAVTNLVFSHVKAVGWNETGFEPQYGCPPWVT